METNGKKPVAQLSIETRLIFEKLQTVAIGEFLSYAELAAVISVDDLNDPKFRCCLTSARNIIRRDHQVIFGFVKGKGITRLTDVQILGTGDRALIRMRNHAKRSAHIITCIDKWDELSNSDRVHHNVMLSMFGVVELMSAPARIKKLEAGVGSNQTDRLLQLANALKGAVDASIHAATQGGE